MKNVGPLITLLFLTTFSPGLAQARDIVMGPGSSATGESSADVAEAGVVDVAARKRQARARAQIAIGVGFQATNLGLMTAQLTGELTGESLWDLQPVAIGVQIGSGIAAPFAINGFRLAHGDGMKGVGVGLLEGGAYSMVSAGLSGLIIAAHDGVYCAQRAAEWDGEGHSPCFEDISGLVHMASAVPHLIIGGAMLISGGIVTGVAGKRNGSVAVRPGLGLLRLPPVLPSISTTQGGVRIGITGVW